MGKGLDSIGEDHGEFVFWFLERTRNLKRERIPIDPAEFIAAIGGLFGAGAKVLERIIVKEMERVFQFPLGKSSFVEAMAMVRREGKWKQSASGQQEYSALREKHELEIGKQMPAVDANSGQTSRRPRLREL